jgi:hypothetical protein
VPGLIATGWGSYSDCWSFSGSMLTFAAPMGLFIVVAIVGYLQFSRPHAIPGHRSLATAHASATPPGRAPSTAAGAGTTGTETAGRSDAGSTAVPPAQDTE